MLFKYFLFNFLHIYKILILKINHFFSSVSVIIIVITFYLAAVEIAQVRADIVGTNPALVEGSTFNRVMFTFEATTTPDSGSVSGERLWDLSIFGSQNPVGDGVKHALKYSYNFNRYQEAKTATGGGVINYGFVDTNFDMTGLVCNDINFICATLRKHDSPSPDFELVPVPDNRVLTDCFRIKCDGKKN